MNIFYELKKLLFPFYKSENIKYIFKTLNEGHEKPQAMFVGGCVRKYLLNQKIDDIDIATVLKPEEIIKKLENTNIKVKKKMTEFCKDNFKIFLIILWCTSKESNPQPADP